MNEEQHVEPLSYREVVERWKGERELLGAAQPHTAQKSAQKALLLASAFGERDVRHILTQDVIGAPIDPSQHGGRKGSGLSSTTLRAAHLAGTQVPNRAILKGLADNNPFGEAKRPREERRQTQHLLPT